MCEHDKAKIHEEHKPSFMSDARYQCVKCGSYTNGKEWKSVCTICNVDVPEGKLVGLFVPHRCGDCNERIIKEEQEKGKVCRMCNKVYSRCYC